MTLSIATIHIKEPSPAQIGFCPCPGSASSLDEDIAVIEAWQAAFVVTLVEQAEITLIGIDSIGEKLAALGIGWHHLPIVDFGIPSDASDEAWAALSSKLHQSLDEGGKVLVHCRGGLGRSGMIAMRLLVERGTAPDKAASIVRSARPGAIETDAQYAWASSR